MPQWNAEQLFLHHPLPWAVQLRAPHGAAHPVPVVVDALGGEPMRKTAGTAVLVALANRLGEIETKIKELENGQR